MTLTGRQKREQEYHRNRAQNMRHLANKGFSTDVATQDDNRRWWNHYWSFYTMLRLHHLKGKNILIPGCGFGKDVASVGALGSVVSGFDLSPESVEIATERLKVTEGIENFSLKISPCEKMPYENNTFDGVLFVDTLHHVNIPQTVSEASRVLKPEGMIFGDEIYTHSFIQKYIRNTWFFDKVLHKRMVRYIYGTPEAYITEDERKIDEHELQFVLDHMKNVSLKYYNILLGRIFPVNSVIAAKLDRIICVILGPLGKYFAGRVLFCGHVKSEGKS